MRHGTCASQSVGEQLAEGFGKALPSKVGRVEDAIAEGFRPIIVKEAVGDRVPGVVAWNLFDMDSKFGDVEPLENVIQYLNNLPDFADTVPTSAIPVARAVVA